MRHYNQSLASLVSFSSSVLLISSIALLLIVVSGIVSILSNSESSSGISVSSSWKWSTAGVPNPPPSPPSLINKEDSLTVAALDFAGDDHILSDSSATNSSSSPIPLHRQSNLLPQLVTTSHQPLFIHSFNSTRVKRKRLGNKLERMEAGLARARASIREAATQSRNLTSTLPDLDYSPRGPIYRNPQTFHRSYLEMEKVFKIFVYEEGEPPMFHNGLCKSIYSTEGLFIHEMEKKDNPYRTNDPNKAHVYFLPFSVVMMVEFLYVPDSHEIHSIGRTLSDYVRVIASKYPYWNRSLGADHFMLSCHDWIFRTHCAQRISVRVDWGFYLATIKKTFPNYLTRQLRTQYLKLFMYRLTIDQGPRTSAYVPQLFSNAIRVLCNANTSEGFNPSKDASFPEIHLRTGEVTGLIGGYSPSRRPIFAFFAGRLHGHIRLLLLEQWKDKDRDVQVYERLPDGVSYSEMLKKSRFCLCPSGYEVASPRIVEAIYAECVPVLISDHYVLPFSDVLNWKSFSVQISVRDIPNIKTILMGISQTQYIRMQRRVKQVQRHFVVNAPPKRFDVFNMIVHSIWLRRLNIRIHESAK